MASRAETSRDRGLSWDRVITIGLIALIGIDLLSGDAG
jgi:hypothetical protein